MPNFGWGRESAAQWEEKRKWWEMLFEADSSN